MFYTLVSLAQVLCLVPAPTGALEALKNLRIASRILVIALLRVFRRKRQLTLLGENLYGKLE